MVQLINIFAVMITFGVVFPPIAVMGCAALYSLTFSAQLLIGRYAQLAPLHDIDRDVRGAKRMFLSSVWMAVPFAVVFYSFLLFDILGDEVGWQRAIWMPTTIIATTTALWIVVQVGRKYFAAEPRMSDLSSSRGSWGRVGGTDEGGEMRAGLLSDETHAI